MSASHRALLTMLVVCVVGTNASVGDEGSGGSVLRPDDPAVRKAVKRGARWLAATQTKKGAFSTDPDHFTRETLLRCGETALGLFALSRSGRGHGSTRVQRALAFVRRELPALVAEKESAGHCGTYTVSTFLMALDDIYGSRCVPGHSGGRSPPAWVRRAASEHGDWLLANRTEAGVWGYPEGPWPGSTDISNTGFALGGLEAAGHLGRPVGADDFLPTLKALLRFQTRPGAAPGSRRTLTGEADVGRGWSYGVGGDGIRGGTTASGVLGVATCLAALPGSSLESHAADARRGIADGCTWLARTLDPTRNPYEGPYPRDVACRHVHCYLFVLSEACRNLGIDTLGDKDWYTIGARHLLATQAKDGSWSSPGTDSASDRLHATCFALLFLSPSERARQDQEPPAPVTPSDG